MRPWRLLKGPFPPLPRGHNSEVEAKGSSGTGSGDKGEDEVGTDVNGEAGTSRGPHVMSVTTMSTPTEAAIHLRLTGLEVRKSLGIGLVPSCCLISCSYQWVHQSTILLIHGYSLS